MLSGTSSGRGSELITPGMTMIRNSDNLGLVRTSIPTWAESFWINGLRGKIDLAANNIKLPVPDASPRPITFERETVTWTIRWDFDPTKGLHVNVDISGRGRRAKFALQPNFAAGVSGSGSFNMDRQREYFQMTVTHLSEVCDWVLTIDRTKQPPTSAPSEWTRSIPPKTDGSPGKDYWITPAFRARTTESEAIQKALNLWEATMACPLN
ncbi:MAG: hypothetical protein M1817_006619 [Caeruleum heppii]|nr:MAG: hypothetical protein M1817_006619 [Caeruleum heppii]